MPASAAAALLLSSALAAAGVPLQRATRAMEEVTHGQESYRHEKGIAPDDAGAIRAHLKRLGESLPEIVRVPGRRGTFLASDFCGGTGERLGRCLMLLESTRGGVRELSRVGPAADAQLTPVVFVGGGRRIVLARLGTEYSRGVAVYEIVDGGLEELGTIDAGVPGELGEEDPTPYARVRLEGRRIVVRFDADLALGTGQQDAPVARKPVVFRHREDGFVREKGPTRARGAR